jgi:hypothetical protein
MMLGKETRMTRSLGFLGLATLLVTAALPAVAADGTSRVDGRVLDAQTKAPLVATLTVLDPSGRTVVAKTDRKGRFSSVGVEPGRVTVSFAAAGFASQAMTCTIPPGETGVFDFRAYAGGTTAPTAYHCTVSPSTQDRYTLVN